MIVPDRKHVCVCSKCGKHIWHDSNNQEHRGKLWSTAATVRNHKEADEVRKRAHIEQNERSVAAAIIRGVVGNSTSPSASLPVRPQDHIDWALGETVLGLQNNQMDAHTPEVLQPIATEGFTSKSSEQPSLSPEATPSDASPTTLTTPAEPSAARLVILQERLRQLGLIESLLCAQRRRITDTLTLRFASLPTALTDVVPELEGTKGDNGRYLSIQSTLLEQLRQLQHLIPLGDKGLDRHRETLINKAEEHLRLLDNKKHDAWEAEIVSMVLQGLDGGKGPVVVSPAEVPGARARSLEPWLLAILMMSAVLHSLAAASRPDLGYVLATMQAVVYALFVYCNRAAGAPPSLTPAQSDLLAAIPSDIRTVFTRLGLDPDIIRYASCPKCRCTYPPNEQNPAKPYPSRCTHRETDKGTCREPLIQPVPGVAGRDEALKYYPYHSLKSWLSALSLRPELLRIARNAWNAPSSTGGWRDIWDAPMLRSFIGPDGRTPFSSQPDGSVHLVFSLFIDWFNPFGNKKAGKSHSIGGIYLVCLNLPPHLRYRPENIYLAGIIPGPQEPELHELNHYLRPLIEELLTLWHRGLYLQQTGLDLSGWFIRVAVVPLVCDLPALRKTAGFAGHSANQFCSFCLLRKEDITNLDRSSWPRRSREEHYAYARRWRDAQTDAERERLFKKYGVRWSELLRLPYWDPTRFSLVDAMHNLFLGELRHHCRNVWGINDRENRSQTGGIRAHSPEEQQEWLDRVAAAIQKGTKMSRIRRGYIAATAEHNKVVADTSNLSKDKCIQVLVKWWGKGRPSGILLPPVLPEPTTDFHLVKDGNAMPRANVLDQPTLSQIRKDIVETYLPSWLEKPPRNFGSAAHGKLKADHWRTVCTVSMVITLVRLWGSTSATAQQSALLENFVHLVCAVDLAARRSIDPERISKFDQHMQEYLSGLRELFTWHQFVPNNHLSLHLKECLESFGPVHAWWAFPFERFNGLLQNLNTNSKSNAMPLTFMRYFYIGASVRWLMGSVDWPDEAPFRNMLDAYRTAFKDAMRGTRVADANASRDSPSDRDADDFIYDDKAATDLPRALYEVLVAHISSKSASSFTSLFAPVSDKRPRLSTSAQHVASVRHNGLNFATAQRQIRDSFVLFKTDASDVPRAGQIQDIFYHVRSEYGGKMLAEPFCLVAEYSPLSARHAAADPYRKFPDLQTRLYYNQFESPALVPMSHVLSHFAAYFYKPPDIGKECIVVRSLDRS